VDSLSTRQIDGLNVTALNYCVSQGYFSRAMRVEKQLLLEQKKAKIAELEKSAFSGKKARKERQLYKEMSLKKRSLDLPLYYDNKYPKVSQDNKSSESSSRSPSPEGKMEYITEFGTEEYSQSSHMGRFSRKRKRDKSPRRRKSRWNRSRSWNREREREKNEHKQNRSRSRSKERESAIDKTKSKLEAKKYY
jgi:hypothetical protein